LETPCPTLGPWLRSTQGAAAESTLDRVAVVGGWTRDRAVVATPRMRAVVVVRPMRAPAAMGAIPRTRAPAVVRAAEKRLTRALTPAVVRRTRALVAELLLAART
jgi:hypothetical protein